MATFEITAPDGSSWEITAPEGATEAQAIEYAKSQWKPADQGSSLARQPGLTARAAIKGALALPAMAGDALFSAGNLVQRAFGAEPSSPPQRSSRALDEFLAKILPTPQNATERVSGSVAEALTGTGVLGKVGQLASPSGAMGKTVASALYGNLDAQAASAAAGSAAGGVTQEAGGPWWAQTLASFGAGGAVGAAAPKFLPDTQVPPVPIPTKTQQNVDTFKAAGTSASAGQATGSNFFAGMENLLAKFPGGQSVIRAFREKQQDELGASADTGGTAEKAGRAIEQGLRGEGGFMDRFKTTRQALYNKLDEHLPLDRKIDTTNTQKVLADINSDIPGAPALSELFKNEKIVGIENALESDLTQKGMMGNPVTKNQAQLVADLPAQKQLPYEAIKKLRTLVGEQIDNASIVSDVPRSKWKALYGALSEDLGIAAKTAGPEAEKAWARANNYNRSAMSRIEGVLDRVIGKDKTPEDIFNAVNPKNSDQMTTLRTAMKSLRPDERKVVTDAVVARLGKATPGKQDDVGSVFSSETFLTNYSRISPQAREVLFADPQVRSSIDAIAKAASIIRDESKVFTNPSGTAGAMAPYMMFGMAASSVQGTAAVGAMIAGANIGAKMLTHPKVVQWLAQTPKVKPSQMSSHLARLGTIYTDTSDPELKSELSNYMESVGR
jgi:hypothetical protein